MSVSEIKAACEAVLNASPSDYEAACEVWTRVCTPQAVLAALQQLEAERDAARRHLGDALSDAKRLADDAWKAAAEAAALREALVLAVRTLREVADDNDIIDGCAYSSEALAAWETATAALATPPSAAVQRVQGIVAALVELTKRAETVAEDLDEGELGPIAEAFNAAIDQALAALNGEEGEG